MILEVIVDISHSEIDRTFDYEGADMPLGSRVAVEFGRKRLIGFVVGKKNTSDYKDLKKATYLDTPVDEEQLALMDAMRTKYNLRHIDVLRLFIPLKLRDEKDPEAKRLFLTLPDGIPAGEITAQLGKTAVKQREAVEYIAACGGAYLSVVASKFGSGAAKALRDKGLLKVTGLHDAQVPLKTINSAGKEVELTYTQRAAVDAIADGKGVFVLHGVTGSGKTEVYLAVIELMLKRKKTAIMLVPEISLTPQMLGIFRARFGSEVALLHSGLNASERYDEWKRLRSGEAAIAVGARSAVFAPLKDLGAIIIDEEHDSSYISEANPRYDTREVAALRSGLCGAVTVMGSATPDIETYMRAGKGEYTLIELPDRIASHKLPDMEIVDMVGEFRNGNRSQFSTTLADALKETLNRGEQAMLFLNRRGFASFMQCKQCGYIPKCDLCDISLTYHKSEDELKCHYCGKRYHALTKCPECGSTELRHGRIGTEKVAEALKELLPECRILRMDNDTTAHKDSYFTILDKFAKGRADVLVGTQMIAKGHDFPNVTLVGILEADAALYFSDYRSSERTFQLVTQVAGRAGRADKIGRVILQTYAPRHYVFYYARTYDYAGFWKKEINMRQVTKFPPFTKIVRVLITSETEEDAVGCARQIYKAVQSVQARYGEFVYLGASRSPVGRMRGLIRYQVLCRIEPDEFERAMPDIYAAANENQPKKGTCFVEINPQSLI